MIENVDTEQHLICILVYYYNPSYKDMMVSMYPIFQYMYIYILIFIIPISKLGGR